MTLQFDSWQFAFFAASALLILAKIWQGWRAGIVRQIVNILALLAAYAVGYFGGGAAGPILHRFIDLPERALAVLGAGVVGVVVYFSVSLLGVIVFKKTSQQSVGLMRLGYGVSGAAVGALYGIFLVWIAILGIRLLGSVAETRMEVAKNPHLLHAGKSAAKPEHPAPDPGAVVRGLAHMKQSLEQGAAGAVVQQVDPIPGTLYGILRKLGLMVSDEKSVERFLAYPGVKPLLAHPKIAALQNDPEITRDIVKRDYFGLLRNSRILAAANDSEIGELMRKFEFEKALDYALRKPEKESVKARD